MGYFKLYLKVKGKKVKLTKKEKDCGWRESNPQPWD